MAPPHFRILLSFFLCIILPHISPYNCHPREKKMTKQLKEAQGLFLVVLRLSAKETTKEQLNNGFRERRPRRIRSAPSRTVLWNSNHKRIANGHPFLGLGILVRATDCNMNESSVVLGQYLHLRIEKKINHISIHIIVIQRSILTFRVVGTDSVFIFLNYTHFLFLYYYITYLIYIILTMLSCSNKDWSRPIIYFR